MPKILAEAFFGQKGTACRPAVLWFFRNDLRRKLIMIAFVHPKLSLAPAQSDQALFLLSTPVLSGWFGVWWRRIFRLRECHCDPMTPFIVPFPSMMGQPETLKLYYKIWLVAPATQPLHSDSISRNIHSLRFHRGREREREQWRT